MTEKCNHRFANLRLAFLTKLIIATIPDGLVVRIRRSHRRGRGSIPRLGDSFPRCFYLYKHTEGNISLFLYTPDKLLDSAQRLISILLEPIRQYYLNIRQYYLKSKRPVILGHKQTQINS